MHYMSLQIITLQLLPELSLTTHSRLSLVSSMLNVLVSVNLIMGLSDMDATCFVLTVAKTG